MALGGNKSLVIFRRIFFLKLGFSPFRALIWGIGNLGVAVAGSIVVDAHL